jgi:hypothetical protein
VLPFKYVADKKLIFNFAAQVVRYGAGAIGLALIFLMKCKLDKRYFLKN